VGSTHIVADIALPTASGLVRQAITHLLRAIEKHDPSLAEKIANASGTRKYLDKIRKVKPAPGTPREKKECDMTPDEKKALFAEVVRESRALARVCKEEHIQNGSGEEALAPLIEILESIATGDDGNITPTPPSSGDARSSRYTISTRGTPGRPLKRDMWDTRRTWPCPPRAGSSPTPRPRRWTLATPLWLR